MPDEIYKLFVNFCTEVSCSVILSDEIYNCLAGLYYLKMIFWFIIWLIIPPLFFLFTSCMRVCTITRQQLGPLYVIFLTSLLVLTTAAPTYYALWQSRSFNKFIEILSIKTMQIWRRMLLKLRELLQLSFYYVLRFLTPRRKPV